METTEKESGSPDDLFSAHKQLQIPHRNKGFQEAGFNHGYQNKKIDKTIEEMIEALSKQRENLRDIKQKELDNNENLIKESRRQLKELTEMREEMSISTFSSKPLSIVMAVLFYLVGLWVTKLIIDINLNILIILMIFNGAWSIALYVFYKTNSLIEWISNKPLLHTLLNTLLVILSIGIYFFSNELYYLYPFSFLITCFSALNLVLFFGSSILSSIDRQIEYKYYEISELERLRIIIYKDMWTLTREIEETKTNALIKFHTGYIYGTSIKANLKND